MTATLMVLHTGLAVDYIINGGSRMRQVRHGILQQKTSKGYIIDDIKYGQSNIIPLEDIHPLGTFGPAPSKLL